MKMKPILIVLALFLAPLLLSHLAAQQAPPKPDQDPFSDWYEGSQGYQKALEESRKAGKPIAVYFYTDWCGYCRQLERELLNTPKVQDHLRSVVRVRIYPEKGAGEQRLAQRYGVSGYPTFFIQPGADKNPRRINRSVDNGFERRLMTPAEFVETLRQAAAG
jgi:thiol:disulfide interchange protein